jgi:hypothetical protein
MKAFFTFRGHAGPSAVLNGDRFAPAAQLSSHRPPVLIIREKPQKTDYFVVVMSDSGGRQAGCQWSSQV